jgi:hypothetical protein
MKRTYLNYPTQISSLALASALAWTAAAADPASNPSQTSSSSSPASASSGDTQTEAKPEKPMPLPLHELGGSGGLFSTLSAYLVNPPRDGEPVGRPAIGFGYINIGYGRDLVATTLTETPWKRLELGFGYEYLNLGDLPAQIAASGGPSIDQNLSLYNANLRLELVKDGEFNQKWLPAITAGIHYKYNTGIIDINNQLHGLLTSIGLSNHGGLDYTLYGTKLLTFLPLPVVVSAGGRATTSVETGLLGFTDEYSYVFEGNVAFFLSHKLVFAGEYKQMPSGFTPIPGLIGTPSNWWTLALAYIINPHMTVATGYGHFGTVGNHTANAVVGISTKYEF